MAMSVIVQAYAKINLTLEVLYKRSDGYHQIASILQSVGLCDTVSASAASELLIEAPGLDCPLAENLILKAARLLQDVTGYTGGACIQVTKRIPQAGGLGGGSSDAAATLVALNRLWGLGLEQQELLNLGTRLGSDVPFFLYGGTALVEGRGEIVTPLPPLSGLWVLLVSPPLLIPAKTRSLYAALSPADYTDGSITQRLAADLRAGRGLDTSLLYNAFERVACTLYPAIAAYREAFLAAGAPFARLSGSGPTLYTLLPDQDEGWRICQRLAARGIRCWLVPLGGVEHSALHCQIGQDML